MFGRIRPNTDKTRTGYTGAWNITGISKGSTGDKTVAAVWTPVQYSITYTNILNGAHTNTTAKYTIESAAITFAAPTRTGYTGAWDISGIPQGSTGDKTVMAVWTGNEYTVTYDARGGTGIAASARVTYGAAYTLAVPARERCVFGGWYGSVGVNTKGTRYTDGDGGSLSAWTAANDDTVLYAYWLGYDDLQYTLISDGAAYSVSKGTANLSEIRIPANYTGKPVTAVGSFSAYVALTDIVIPNGVTSIGFNAFSGCDGLTSITVPFVGAALNGTDKTHFGYIFGASWYYNLSYVPSSLRTVVITGSNSIGSYAFSSWSGLTSIELPLSVTSIGAYAFSGCSGLTSIVIPSSITSMGGQVFSGCIGLTSITVDVGNTIYRGEGNCLIRKDTNTLIAGCKNSIIPSSVTSIGYYAFSGCVGLTSIVIPPSVTSIGERAFAGCVGLANVEMPSVMSIGIYAFSGCNVLTSVEMPSVTSIGTYAFSGCVGLTNVEIPSVTSIGERAFVGCIGLASIKMPLSMTGIESYVFIGCSGLTSIVIPSSIMYIWFDAFYGCNGLTTVYYGGADIAAWNAISINSSGNASLTDATRYYYSETQPATAGNYWHYVDGVPTKWE